MEAAAPLFASTANTDTVSFVVLGHAAPAGSKRAFKHSHTGRIMVTDASKRSKPWQSLVAAAGDEAMNGRPLFTGPLELRIGFYQPRPAGHHGTGRNSNQIRRSAPQYPATRPDVLKLARGVEDALTGVCWRDDALIVNEVLTKRYGQPARAEVTVVPLTDTPTKEAPQ